MDDLRADVDDLVTWDLDDDGNWMAEWDGATVRELVRRLRSAATPEPTLDAERLRVLWPAGANWSSGKREVIIELGPIVDGRCSSCGASPSRETGSCRCLPTIAARLHERTKPTPEAEP